MAGIVRARLLAVSDPTTPIAVAAATAVPVDLAIAVTHDPTVAGDVNAAVAAALLDPPSGFLRVESVGIGRPVYFSALFAAIHAVSGVVSTSGQWSRGGTVETDSGDLPAEGDYAER